MATSKGGARRAWKHVAQEVGFLLLGAWIFGGAIFYYLRFTTIFYEDNRGAIDGAFEAIRSAFGLGG